MAWMELHTVLIRHRKIKKLSRTLKIEPHEAVGHIVTFWGNVLELAEDGNITKWSIEDISEYANYKGDCSVFYSAMLNGGDGWIDEIDGLRLVHDWLDYAGRYLKSKYRNTHPEKLEYIHSLYHRQSKDSLKTVNIPNIPNIPNNVLVCFYDSYRQKLNQDYIKDTIKDRAIIKSLLKTIKEEELKELIVKFFDSQDKWIKESGYTISVFKSQINKLRLKPKQTMNYL